MLKRLLILLLLICSNGGFLNAQNSLSSITEKKYNNVYALVVGISDYTDVKDLNYAHDDAALFYEILQQSFPESKENMILLQNKEATDRAVKKSIYTACKSAQEGDLLVFYFSGHGDVMQSFDKDHGYFLCVGASKEREYEFGGAVRFDWINEYIEGVTSVNNAEVWLITDACRAGNVINDKGANATMASLNSSFNSTTKFVSCQSHELSYEDSTLAHGVFTYYLARGLAGEANSDGVENSLTIDELNTYLKREVRKYTQNKQTPRLTTSDEFKEFFNVSPAIALFLKEIDEDRKMDLASRGAKGEGDDKSKELERFEQALYSGDLYGSGSSAREILQASKGSVTEREAQLMLDMLTEALLRRGQRNINLFLSGRPMISKNESFESSAEDMRVAISLLGEDDFMIDEITERKRFFEVMIIVKNDDHKKFGAAEKELLALQELSPRAAYLNQGLAMLYMKMAKNSEAESQLNLAQSKVETWNKPRNTEALLKIKEGKLTEANAVIEAASGVNENNEDLPLLKAQLHTVNFELQLAEQELEKVDLVSHPELEKDYLILQGKINDLKGRVKVSESFYKKALKKDEKDVEVMLRLAELYRADQDTANAVHFYEQVLTYQPSNVQAKQGLITLHGLKAERAKDINLYNTNAVLAAVDAFIAGGENDEAIDLLEDALKVSKYDPELNYALGKAYYRNKDFKKSEEQLKAAIEKSPFHFESIKSLTYLYILQKDFEKASALIESHEDNFRYSSKWRVFKYEAYKLMRNKENTVFILMEAIKLDSTDTEAYKALYNFYLGEADYRQAEAQFLQMRKLGSRTKDSLAFLTDLVVAVNQRIEGGAKDGRTVEGIRMILKHDPKFLGNIIGSAQDAYYGQDYYNATRHLNRFNNYLFSLGTADQMVFYDLKAKVLLEAGYYREALDLFKQTNRFRQKPKYLGIAMAQYELGFDENAWVSYMRKDSDTRGFNQAAMERYKKMAKNKGY